MKKDKHTQPFDGFSQRTIQFLRDLRDNNYKEWFEENRAIYEETLLKPFRSLIATLSPTMYNIDSSFELRPQRVMSRIYRDVRFSKNKEPYKTSLWITFQIPVPRGEWQNYPGYFFELTPDECVYGMGLYQAKKKIMDDFRDKLQQDSQHFESNTKMNVLGRGFHIEGDNYKRTLDNDLPEYFQSWYQKKSVYVLKKQPINDNLFTSKFAEDLREDFLALEWLYNFMKED